MGFFSWITQDTKKSIANVHSEKVVFPVTMTDNNGNKWHEPAYEGYGEFGGKDYYELLAEMNGLGSDRNKGIDLVFSDKPYISPNLTEDLNWKWVNKEPENCPDQGYFY
jgi:hypothetical protein